MISRWLTAGILTAALAASGRADDKSKLPEEPPPRLVSIIEVKDDVVTYRDFRIMIPLMPRKAGPLKPKELMPALPLAGPRIACAVEFSLQEGKVYDTEGTKLTAAAARKRLAPGDTVLVSMSGQKVDPAYRRVFKKGTLVLVHAPPPPGPSLPGPPLPNAPGRGGR